MTDAAPVSTASSHAGGAMARPAGASAASAASAVESGLSVPLPSLAGAVEEHVRDGDCVWIGNFGCQLFAVGRELIRQERRDLHVVIASGGILLDQLVAGGVVGAATFAHCWSPVGPLPTRAFRRAWEQGGEIAWHELSVGAIVAALTAGAQGVPFAPIALDERTGYVAGGWSGDAIGRAHSPFGEATVVRALVPDVAFVHAVAADRAGNAALGAPAGEATLAAQAARRVVVVAEELSEDGPVTLPGVLVDAVVVEPGAAAPDGVAGRYPRDVEAYLAYGASAATPAPAPSEAPA